MAECLICERDCENFEYNEDACCFCGGLSYDEKCMNCRQEQSENEADSALDRMKEARYN